MRKRAVYVYPPMHLFFLFFPNSGGNGKFDLCESSLSLSKHFIQLYTLNQVFALCTQSGQQPSRGFSNSIWELGARILDAERCARSAETPGKNPTWDNNGDISHTVVFGIYRKYGF